MPVVSAVHYVGGDAATGEVLRSSPREEDCCRAFYAFKQLQRSVLTDGRQSILLFHLFLHISAMACTAIGCAYAMNDFSNHQINVAASFAIAFEAVGIFLTLVVGAVVTQETYWIFTKGITYASFLLALFSSVTVFTLTFNSTATFSVAHIMLTIAIPLQILAFSFVLTLAIAFASRHSDPANPNYGKSAWVYRENFVAGV